MELIRPFSELGKNDAGIAGGKGASLGEMTQAGIPVPPGFVIHSSAFETFLDEGHLRIEIDAILSRVNHEEMHSIESASEKIQTLILSAKMPEDIAALIYAEHEKLGADFVAVRSSATAEDSSSAAWAGQLDTYLNTTNDRLVENVQRCWASLFTPRAIFYRFEKGMQETAISVAVVVQKMVESEVSGIAFSVHPVTEDYNQIIIEAGFGLGEAIVSGQVTPDSFVVEKNPRRIIDKNISTQTRALVRAGKDAYSTIRANGGIAGRTEANEWRVLSNEEGSKPTLTDAQVLELSDLVVKIENHYGFPCDIEWAFVAGQFFITQSRPITTLSKPGLLSNADLSMGDFVLGFEVTNQPLIFQELLGNYYFPEGGVYVASQNILKSYILRSVATEVSKKGTQYFSDLAAIQTVSDELTNVFTQLRECKIQWQGNKAHSGSDVRDILNLAVRAHELYGHFYTAFTDGAYALDDKHPQKAQILAFIDKGKNEFRTIYNEVFFEQAGLFTEFLKQLARQAGTGPEDTRFYLKQELQALCDGEKIPPEVIKERRDAYVFILLRGRHEFLQGTLARQFIERFGKADTSNSGQIVGVSANKGKACGKVKIVNSDYANFDNTRRAMREMERGDVLVSVTTAPELMEACNKASAIVTDLGGLLSHAAIVSRELGIPCIVGTQHATKLLKDGDMVEVDADSGIVRIVSAREPLVLLGVWNVYPFDMWGWFAAPAIQHFQELTGVAVRVFAYVQSELNYECVFKKELNTLRENLEANVSEVAKKAYVQKIYDDFELQVKVLEKALTEAEETEFPSLSDIQIADAIEKRAHAWTKVTMQIWYAVFLDIWYPQQEQEQAIKEIAAKARDHTGHLHARMYAIDRDMRAEISKRLDISAHALNYLFPAELTDAIRNRTDLKAKIEQRTEICVMESISGGEFNVHGADEARRLVEQYNPPALGKESLSTLVGTPASKGTVRGVARVIRLDRDFEKFKEGEILVALQTMVHYLPIMKKSSAILTEFGGLTSHAAIVSRELKKPAIVGITNLLASIKDGDMVEVDAENGIVRKLESSPRSKETKNEWVFMWSGAPPSVLAYWGASMAAKEYPERCLYEKLFSYYDGTEITTYALQSSLERIQAESGRLLDQGYFKQYLRDYRRASKGWWRRIRDIEAKKYADISAQELATDMQALFSDSSLVQSFFDSTVEGYIHSVEHRLEELLKESLGGDAQDAFQDLTTPPILDGIQEEHLEWLTLSSKHPSDAMILEHASRHPWLLFGQIEQPSVLQYFKERAEYDIGSYDDEFNRQQSEKKELKKRQKALYKKLGNNAEETEYLSDILHTFAIEHTQLKAYYDGTWYMARNLLHAVADLLLIPWKDIFSFLNEQEITSALQSGDTKSALALIADRKKSYAIYYDGNTVTFLNSNDAIDFYMRHVKVSRKDIESFQGQVAFRGIVTGRVRKVISGDLDVLKEANGRFNDGDILVTSMTAPNMMMIARRAGAIITNEGGITCHAAIIARELKIPAIISTKIATQVLNEGDMVEVDSNNGIIKVVQKTA